MLGHECLWCVERLDIDYDLHAELNFENGCLSEIFYVEMRSFITKKIRFLKHFLLEVMMGMRKKRNHFILTCVKRNISRKTQLYEYILYNKCHTTYTVCPDAFMIIFIYML